MKVICLHANSGSAKTFDNLELNIPHQSLSILGHDGRNIDHYSLEIWKTDLIEQLKGEEDFILLGNSLGGLLALEIVNEVKGIKGLVLVGAPPLKKPLNIEEAYLPYPLMAESFKEEVEPKLLDQVFEDMLFNKHYKNKLITYFLETDPKVRSILGAEVANGNLSDGVEILKGLSIPVLMINGAKDQLVNLSYLKSLQQTFSFQNEIIPQAGHYSQLENPEVFTEVMNSFSNSIFN